MTGFVLVAIATAIVATPATARRIGGIGRSGSASVYVRAVLGLGALGFAAAAFRQGVHAFDGGAPLPIMLPVAGLSGYAAWRFTARLLPDADRLHWSAVGATGTALTVWEVYGALGALHGHAAFMARLAGMGGYGLAAALTVAAFGVATLVQHQRWATDRQISVRLAWWAGLTGGNTGFAAGLG